MLFEVSQDYSPETPSGENAPSWTAIPLIPYLLIFLQRYKKILKLPNIFTAYLSDIQTLTLNNTNTEHSLQTKLLNYRTLQNCDQILPVHTVTLKTILIPILQEHETIPIGKDLLMDIVGMILKVHHLHLPAIFGHKNKYVTIVRIVMCHLLDYLE
jgi:hypothetical protein